MKKDVELFDLMKRIEEYQKISAYNELKKFVETNKLVGSFSDGPEDSEARFLVPFEKELKSGERYYENPEVIRQRNTIFDLTDKQKKDPDRAVVFSSTWGSSGIMIYSFKNSFSSSIYFKVGTCSITNKKEEGIEVPFEDDEIFIGLTFLKAFVLLNHLKEIEVRGLKNV